MTPLLQKNVFDQANYSICGAKINLTECEDYKHTFARIESDYSSDCTLRFGFKVLMKSISYTKRSYLFLHFLRADFIFQRTNLDVTLSLLKL